jgi:LacI family transcriptional regulator
VVKISDVAKMAQVSVATVSRILSGDESFSATDQTRKRVFATASQLGYQPVRHKKPNLSKINAKYYIGLLMTSSQEEEVNDPYYLSIRLGIEKRCAAMGIVLKNTIRLNASLSQADFADLDGLIVVGSIDPQPLVQNYFQSPNIVCVNNVLQHDPGFDAVLSDLAQATEGCVNTLYDLGHRSIGYIGGSEIIHNVETHQNQLNKDIRHQAFETRMQQLGLFNPEQVFIGNWTALDGQRMAREAIRQGQLPTAFVIASDPLSMGVIHAFREEGIQVPADISVISFDDIEAAAFMNPPLSSVRVFTEEIGRQAANILVDRLSGREVVVNVVVPSKLSIRQSYTLPRTSGELNIRSQR